MEEENDRKRDCRLIVPMKARARSDLLPCPNGSADGTNRVATMRELSSIRCNNVFTDSFAILSSLFFVFHRTFIVFRETTCSREVLVEKHFVEKRLRCSFVYIDNSYFLFFSCMYYLTRWPTLSKLSIETFIASLKVRKTFD